MQRKLLAITLLISILLAACQAGTPETVNSRPEENKLKVLAVESFLADITQHIAGERVQVEVLIPPGADPHAFQPTPQDVAKIAESQLLIANGAGLEQWLQEVIDNAGGERLVVEAAQDLEKETTRPGDPHFWLDPIYAIHYANAIRDVLIQLDPSGEAVYTQNANEYVAHLDSLDDWIRDQVALIPPEKRQMVTNHESFGYFADRYDFDIIGTIIPSVSTGSSPSAQQLVELVEAINATQTDAIFLETGSNPDLAEQLGQEAGITVIVDLRTQPLYPQEGYLEMMKYNTKAIVDALR